jgi:hypothetical protein
MPVTIIPVLGVLPHLMFCKFYCYPCFIVEETLRHRKIKEFAEGQREAGKLRCELRPSSSRVLFLTNMFYRK